MNNGRQDELELQAGELYGERYRIVMQIGKGGMGRVYLAEDIRLGGKARALKLTKPLTDERRSFLPEAQMLSELDHAHLPAIVDYYPPNEAGVACIVMDYIAGDTLAERFERYRFRLPFDLVLRVMVHLCDVLIYLHGQNPAIVFRDLKPANVLLDRHNNAILVDFGIARRFQAERQSDTLQLGTPGFAAPEQLRGEQSDHRTDLYGLGALAYHLLSGGQFALRHRGEMKRVLQGDVPNAFCLLLERMLAHRAEDRPQTATELSLELISIKQPNVGFELFNDMAHDNDRPQSKMFSSFSEQREQVTVIAFASAYPGAGATFASLAFSSALSRSGISHALVECPGGDAELYAWLDGSRRMPKGAVFAEASGQQAAAPAWRKGNVSYYPTHPEEAEIAEPNGLFASWLRRLGVPIVLLDVSDLWEGGAFMEWLARTVDRVWIVGDCYPAKWSNRRQVAAMEFFKYADQHGLQTGWIANRDQAFRDRKQWLSLFPSYPLALLPDLSSQPLLNALWSGEGMPTDTQTCQLLDTAFQKLISSITKRR
ncbi:serine/threonine protein kinase [Cohnella sp.]|uniref:serine/threonine protein kinase n=1 Tax=Cohnella sp. TaxID=1883426 RepID=UPI0035638C9F